MSEGPLLWHVSCDLTPYRGRYEIGARVYPHGCGGGEGTIVAVLSAPELVRSLNQFVLVQWDESSDLNALPFIYRVDLEDLVSTSGWRHQARHG